MFFRILITLNLVEDVEYLHRIEMQEEKRFKNITETYKMNIFLLKMSLMYPNPRQDGKRKVRIGFFIISLIPMLLLIYNDMRLRILHNDIANLVRQTIITVMVTFVIIKLILTIVRSYEMTALFNEINEDYEKYNDLPEEYQQTVIDTIEKTKTLEKAWIIILGITAASYPGLAFLCTTYSSLFSENPRRFMVHEMAIVFLTEEEKYESPYYEIIVVYSTFIAFVAFIGFSGYDGMFTVCIMHVSLKIKIFSLNLKYLFIDMTDTQRIKRNIAKFVTDHCDVMRLVGDIQKCYEIWLVGIFFVSVLQIGMALTQITSGAGIDTNGMYYLFLASTVLYIYIPCYLISDVTYNAGEVANIAYNTSWESIPDLGVRKSICIIIAKAQIPINFRALNMLTFNMEMFESILQTSYSMYTLLRS